MATPTRSARVGLSHAFLALCFFASAKKLTPEARPFVDHSFCIFLFFYFSIFFSLFLFLSFLFSSLPCSRDEGSWKRSYRNDRGSARGGNRREEILEFMTRTCCCARASWIEMVFDWFPWVYCFAICARCEPMIEILLMGGGKKRERSETRAIIFFFFKSTAPFHSSK